AAIDYECSIFAKNLKKFIDNSISYNLWNLLYEGTEKKWNNNIKILNIKQNLKRYLEISDEIVLKD
ncbi:17239_t:CDS:1, partial [Acaulospora colombiana]